ncbi:hypothetical protein Fot_06820 [Forsythia ovata]|uniref:Uncharacterized protein n=1 Tax=Forsythia ovata TaxID=205694 RepID=A0ABD1WU31_9LAMI
MAALEEVLVGLQVVEAVDVEPHDCDWHINSLHNRCTSLVRCHHMCVVVQHVIWHKNFARHRDNPCGCRLFVVEIDGGATIGGSVHMSYWIDSMKLKRIKRFKISQFLDLL